LPRDFYFLLSLAACLASALSALAIYLRDPAHESNRVATLLVGGTAYWALCQALWTSTPSAESALLLHRISGPGWTFIGPLALHLVLSVTRSQDRRVRRGLLPLYALGGAASALQAGTHWITASALPEPWGWGFVSGPGHVLFLVFTLACALPAVAIGLRYVGRAPSPAERSQVRLLALGVASPLLIATLTSGLLPVFGLQTPRFGSASFAALGVTVAWSYYRFGFSAFAPGSFSREILEILPDGVALVGLDGELLTANGGMARLLGTPPERLAGEHLDSILDRDVLSPPSEIRELECELRAADGARVPVALSTSLLHDKRGLAFGIVLVLRDLREVVDLRKRLVTSARMAAVGELAAGIAHEINNPIAFVGANLAQLRGRWAELAEGSPPEQRELVAEGEELIEESIEGVERTAAIVQDVKGFAHGGSGQHQLVDLNELLCNALRVAKPQLRFRARLETDLRPLPLVLGAAQELKQVFLNLIVNASQAVQENGTIRVETRPEAGAVLARIRDDGCGIPPEDMERIFDPFFTTKPVGEGTGLGLAISYRIVRNHGAEICADSKVGEGTTFTLRFPTPEP
jgi:two-component system NtrC family sensor kinase